MLSFAIFQGKRKKKHEFSSFENHLQYNFPLHTSEFSPTKEQKTKLNSLKDFQKQICGNLVRL